MKKLFCLSLCFFCLASKGALAGDFVVTLGGQVSGVEAGAVYLTGTVDGMPEDIEGSNDVNANFIGTDNLDNSDGAWIVDIVSSGANGSFSSFEPEQINRWNISTGGNGSTGDLR